MLDPTPAGPSKWDAIRAALDAFVSDPASAGLGVGLQYFPLRKPGVPAVCTTHAECGAGAPCFLTVCDNTTAVTLCTADSECGRGGHCVPFGLCELSTPQHEVICPTIGGQCSGGYGRCLDISNRF